MEQILSDVTAPTAARLVENPVVRAGHGRQPKPSVLAVPGGKRRTKSQAKATGKGEGKGVPPPLPLPLPLPCPADPSLPSAASLAPSSLLPPPKWEAGGWAVNVAQAFPTFAQRVSENRSVNVAQVGSGDSSRGFAFNPTSYAQDWTQGLSESQSVNVAQRVSENQSVNVADVASSRGFNFNPTSYAQHWTQGSSESQSVNVAQLASNWGFSALDTGSHAPGVSQRQSLEVAPGISLENFTQGLAQSTEAGRGALSLPIFTPQPPAAASASSSYPYPSN